METRQLSSGVMSSHSPERSTLLPNSMLETKRTEGEIEHVEPNPDSMRLSVIVVGKNEQNRIASCLESVIAGLDSQNRDEIIYVDNESEDHTLEIAGRYPIAVIRRRGDRVRSPYAAGYADGVRLSKGTFVQFLDADSILDPSWLNFAFGYMTANPDIGIVAGRVVEATPADTLLGRVYKSHCERISEPGEQKKIDGPAFMVRRKCFEDVGLPDPNIGIGGAMELNLGVRIRAAGYRVVRLDKPMAIHQGPRKGAARRVVKSSRNGYRFARTLLKLVRNYPDDPFVSGLLTKNLLQLMTVIAMVVFVWLTGLMGLLLICVLLLVSLLAISAMKKRGIDMALFLSLSVLFFSIGFAVGMLPVLKKCPKDTAPE